jgi:hypothetical protein
VGSLGLSFVRERISVENLEQEKEEFIKALLFYKVSIKFSIECLKLRTYSYDKHRRE